MEVSIDRILGICGVLGIVIGAGLAIAADPKSRGEVLFAIGCFIFSGLMLSITLGIWAFGATFSIWYRLLVFIPLFAFVGISMTEASRWAYGRYLGTIPILETKTEPFSVALDITFFGETRDSLPVFWIVSRGPNLRVSPTNAALFLTILNRQSIPSMISRYEVEMRTADGRWAPLISLPVVPSEIYASPDLKMARLVRDKSVFLETAIQNHNLQPHEPVRGWALFQYSRRYGPTFVPEFKVTITDYAGVSYSSPILSSKPGDIGVWGQFGTIPVAGGNPVDLSKLQRGFYYPDQ